MPQNTPLKSNILSIFLVSALVCLSTLPGAARAIAQQSKPPAPAESGNIDETKLTDAEMKSAAALVESFLASMLSPGKDYDKFITTEVTDSYIENFYMIDRFIIKNYRRAVQVRPDGEALVTYTGPDETIIQEMTVRKEHDGALKINSLGEKRYVRMSPKRRQCYINTRTIYLVSAVLNALTENMELPAEVTFDLLKSKGLLREPVKCPDGGEIAIKVVKSPDGQSNDVLPQCSKHGDLYELYKIDDRSGFDFDKYNKEIDAEQAILSDKIAGDVYKTFLKIQPFENTFYEAIEAQNLKLAADRLAEAVKIDRRVGHMYLNMIKAYRKARDEKKAREIFDQAAKVYPKWEALKKSLTEDILKEEEHEY